jgi:hypothetical protein
MLTSGDSQAKDHYRVIEGSPQNNLTAVAVERSTRIPMKDIHSIARL